jgi:hypothetical protein
MAFRQRQLRESQPGSKWPYVVNQLILDDTDLDWVYPRGISPGGLSSHFRNQPLEDPETTIYSTSFLWAYRPGWTNFRVSIRGHLARVGFECRGARKQSSTQTPPTRSQGRQDT